MGLRTLSFGKRHYMIIKILTGIVLFLPGKILQELGRTQSNRDWCCVVSSDEAVEIWDFFFFQWGDVGQKAAMESMEST